jgi:ornithine cyclodeaminase/alanine dehydrogenase-like protein (mu-crystallin family)
MAENNIPDALLLTASDLMPLRTNLDAMEGALAAVEAAVLAYQDGQIRQYNVQDRRPGEFEGIRVSLSAGDGLYSGMRIFGNPPHTRAFMLFEGETRQLICLMDYGVLNSMRVGAIAGVAGRHLAPRGAKVMGLIGSGWQAGPQVVAMLRGVPSLELIKVYSPTRANREAFAAEMSSQMGKRIEPVASIADAIDDADIIDLCAPGHHDVREPLFDSEWVKPGALVVSMASAQCTPEFVRSARVVATNWYVMAEETKPKAPYDALIAGNAFGKDDLTELGSVLTGKANPRRSPSDRVLYELTGGNFHDLFVATWGYEWARSQGLGHSFDLRA